MSAASGLADATDDMAVRFEAVSRSFGSGAHTVTAVNGVDLRIPRGVIHGVIGHSGAGKSTLIRLVNALERPTAGRVLVDGIDIGSLDGAALREARKQTAMIFQQFELLQTVTVLDNVAMPLRLDGIGRREARRAAAEALEFVGLAEVASRYPAKLSGGQKQRVGIARAIVRRPAVLLSDEATSALDPTTTRQILELLRRVNREYGTTILVVTHEMDVIKDLCSTVTVMSAGRVVEHGSVMDVFVQPEDAVTADFVSSVIPQDLPPRVRRTVGDAPLWRLRFVDDEVTSPIVGALIGEFGLRVNILHADMTDIQDRTVGHMIIQVDGHAQARADAWQYLSERIVRLEEVTA